MVINELKIDNPEKERRFSEILKSFKVNFDYINLNQEKYFDVYDIKLSFGTRISKIETLIDDIGLQMMAYSKPISYAVHNKGIYRVEIQRDPIVPKDILGLMAAMPSSHVIPICLGTDKSGEDLIVDLNKIPNLLIGGTTGSGKSVLLHNIILSLIYRDADIYLADPKFVEFSMYSGLKQVKWIDNSSEQLSSTLSHLKKIMNHRYSLLLRYKARNIKEYSNLSTTVTDMKPIVLVIDEWADLVLSNKDLQAELCCIAQKGRAAGIGIVLATQRPSVNVVSGMIKANFPGRICLRVASQVDSKVILDRAGGESLTDVGTGLYIDGFTKSPIHFKSDYIEDISKALERI